MARPSLNMEWDAHEYEHKERSSDWFWAVGIISVSIAIAAIIFNNIIFAILVLLATFTLSIFASRPPTTLHMVLNEKGVTRGRVHYPFSTLKSFWIDIEHPHKKIILESQKMFMPLIIIPLNAETNVDELHENLSTFLAEEFHTLPFVERILEYLGF